MSLYIERMFRRKGAGDSPFDRHEVLAGLSWIAQQAKNHSQILMHIEGLQPSWIGNIRWNWSYWIGSRCISTFIIALLTAWSFLPPLEGETYISLGQVGYWCMYWALIGVAGGILDGLEGSKTLPMSPPWDRAIKFRRILTYVLLSVFYFTIGTSFTIANSKGTWSNIAAGSIILGGLYGLLDHARSRKRTRDADIHTFEGWTWSWPHAWNGYVQGYAWGILSSAIFCTIMAIIAVCELYMVLTGSMSLETYPLLSVSVLWWSLLALSLLSMLMGLTIWILCFRHPDKGKGRKISYWLMGKWTSTDWVTVPRQKELWIMLGIAEVTCGLTFLVLYYFPPRLDSATTIEFYRNFIQAVFVIAGVLPLVLGLFPAFIKGIRTGTVDLKIKPNQGILLSARNSLVVGAIAWLVICIIDILVLTITNKPTFENVLYDLRKSLFLALLLCAWYGRDVIHHYVLRLVLWAGGYTPLRLVRFLNQGVKLVFLQKVGGGYIFIHRLVMEHFASLKEPSPEHLPNAAAAVHAQERVNS